MIGSETSRNGYTGNGAVSNYVYSFKIDEDADLRVRVLSPLGAQHTLVLTTDYTVVDAGDPDGGSINLVAGVRAWMTANKLTSGWKISIRRRVELLQEENFSGAGSNFLSIVESEVDRLTMMIQGLQDEVDRSLKLPETIPSTTISPTLPADIVANGANKAIAMNAAGDAVADADDWPTVTEIADAQAQATAAAASAAAALISETNAAASATAAAASAVAAAASAASVAADTAAATAAAAAALVSQTAAAASAVAAAASATTASTQATNAATSASGAATSASGAATSATTATTQASNASASASAAATSASNAATSETNAAASAASAAGAVATHAALTATHGVAGAILGTTDVQIITNKDIDGGTATNARRITIPSAAKATLDALARKAGTVVFATDTLKFYYDNGSVLVAPGGGGGGALNWIAATGNAPTPSEANFNQIYLFESAQAQELYAAIRVPASYTAGAQITLKVPYYSPDVSGTALLSTVATLIRTGTDAITSTTNQRTSTNAALNLATSALANKLNSHTCDLTSSTGQINSVSVSAGDFILVKLTRGTDTATSDIAAIPDGAEISFG